jgi:hypothetical protein
VTNSRGPSRRMAVSAGNLRKPHFRCEPMSQLRPSAAHILNHAAFDSSIVLGVVVAFTTFAGVLFLGYWQTRDLVDPLK